MKRTANENDNATKQGTQAYTWWFVTGALLFLINTVVGWAGQSIFSSKRGLTEVRNKHFIEHNLLPKSIEIP